MTITFKLRDGQTRTLTAGSATVMEAARAAGIPGIIAECGGACACGACHVHLSPEILDRLGPATTAEANILEFEETAGPASRLSCQIRVADVPEGAVFVVPQESL